jgi:hypothetical protein
MGAPRNLRLPVIFDQWFPQGLYLVGEITPVTEYQSPEDRARNRPVRPRTDEVSGLPLFRGTFADPAAEKDREKSVTMDWHSYYTDGPNKRRRKAIPAMCGMHRGPIGFANLLVSMQGGSIVFDPHVTGACVIALDEEGAKALRNILTE